MVKLARLLLVIWPAEKGYSEYKKKKKEKGKKEIKKKTNINVFIFIYLYEPSS